MTQSLKAGIRSTVSLADDDDVTLLCPHFAGMAPELADLAGVLPMRGINEELIAHLSAHPIERVRPVYAGFLAVDPFVTGPSLFRALIRRGVHGVVNLPTLAFAEDDFRAALQAGGMDHAREIAVLSQAADEGLEPMATVFSVEQGIAASKAGITQILVHPGLVAERAAHVRALADGIASVVSTLRKRLPSATIWLYRHPAIATLLDEAASVADGKVDWKVADHPLVQERP